MSHFAEDKALFLNPKQKNTPFTSNEHSGQMYSNALTAIKHGVASENKFINSSISPAKAKQVLEQVKKTEFNPTAAQAKPLGTRTDLWVNHPFLHKASSTVQRQGFFSRLGNKFSTLGSKLKGFFSRSGRGRRQEAKRTQVRKRLGGRRRHRR